MAASCTHDGWRFVGWMDDDDGLPPRWYGCRSCGAALPHPSASDGHDVATRAAIDVEQMLAEALAENACLYEPGAERDAADQGSVDAALITIEIGYDEPPPGMHDLDAGEGARSVVLP